MTDPRNEAARRAPGGSFNTSASSKTRSAKDNAPRGRMAGLVHPIPPDAGRVDFQRVAADALQRADAVLCRWLPEGKRQGSEYTALNPTRSDSTPGSFSVNVVTGKWSDFATGDKGGDLVSLVAYLDGIGQGDAARRLAEFCGSPAAGPIRAPRPSKPRPPDTAVAPIPADAPAPPDRHPVHGEPSARWTYCDAAGAVLFRVLRFDTAEGKQVLPQSLHRDPGGLRWRWKGLATPRPLYRLDALAAAPDLPVLIVEGEKSADAAARLLPGWVATTSPNGSNSASSADWGPLAGRRCVIWSDADPAGSGYAADVQRLALDAGAESVAVAPLEELAAIRGDALPQGFDAADAEAERLDAAALDAWLQQSLEATPAEGAEEPAAAEELTDDGRPRIPVTRGELPRVADSIEDALIRAGAPIFARGEQLVRAVPASPEPGPVRRADVATILVPVTQSSLLDDAERHATFIRFRKGGDGSLKHVRADCPPLACRVLLERVGRWRFRHLRGIASCPFMRADGSIASRPGYDAESGLLLAIPSDWPTPKPSPTHAEALAALAKLRHLIRTFPWATPVDESVALAAILTPLVRPGVPAVPLIGFSATAPGTGKGLLADVVSTLATGRPAAAMTWGPTPEENTKVLTGALLAGDAVMVLDNIEVPLRGELLCSALTQTAVRLRPLGTSQPITIPNSATILATGNGLTVAGDMTRRALICQLDAGCERPELRVFLNNPVADALACRIELVNAGLTILRAAATAEFPRPAPLGSFGEWSRRVRDPLIWLGMPDPLDAMGRNYDADPEREASVAILHAWRERFGGSVQTAASVLAAATGNHPGELGDALALLGGPGGMPTAKSFGRWLRVHEGRIVDGLVLRQSGGLNTKNGKRYRVDVHADPGAGGVCGLYGVSFQPRGRKNWTEEQTAEKKASEGLEETPQTLQTPPSPLAEDMEVF
jgi:putative DNA primase/helicase